MSNAEQPIAATDLLGDLDLKLPAGFELIAADPKLGPQILSSLARIEERLAEAIAQTDHLADVASRHLLSAGGKRVRPPAGSALRSRRRRNQRRGHRGRGGR